MKTNLTFRSLLLVFLMVILTFSHSFVILAQQISAEEQAKLDAEADVDKLLWIGAGSAVFLLPIFSFLIGPSVPQSYSGGSGIQILSNEQGWGICIGAVGSLGTLTLILMYQQTPPPERFIGKSPEYIDVYTDVYLTRTRRLKGLYTSVGLPVGCAIGRELTF